MKLEELLERVKEIDVDYPLENSYADLYNAVIDYENETQDWSFDEMFQDFIDYETAEEIAKNEINTGGLERLYYFLGDCSFHNEELFKIDGYGNLANVDKDDIEMLKDELIDEIERQLGE